MCESDLFSPEEMQNFFEVIKEVDAEGRDWWNSRRLARLNTKLFCQRQSKIIPFGLDKLTEGL